MTSAPHRRLRDRLVSAVDRRLARAVDRRVREVLDTPEVARLVEGRAGAAVAAALAAHVADTPHQRPADELRTPRVFGTAERVHVHPTAVVNNALLNVESGEIHVLEYAFFGHNVSLLTGTHDVNARGAARQKAVPPSGRDIVVQSGAWIGSNATVLGPAVIGADAVVAAGAVVTGDVPAHAVVGGVPARVLRML